MHVFSSDHSNFTSERHSKGSTAFGLRDKREKRKEETEVDWIEIFFDFDYILGAVRSHVTLRDVT